MAHSISPGAGNDHALRTREHRPSAWREGDDAEVADDAFDVVSPEVSERERNRQRVWRGVSWMVLVNVVVFWLMTCITAFASTPA